MEIRIDHFIVKQQTQNNRNNKTQTIQFKLLLRRHEKCLPDPMAWRDKPRKLLMKTNTQF